MFFKGGHGDRQDGRVHGHTHSSHAKETLPCTAVTTHLAHPRLLKGLNVCNLSYLTCSIMGGLL